MIWEDFKDEEDYSVTPSISPGISPSNDDNSFKTMPPEPVNGHNPKGKILITWIIIILLSGLFIWLNT